jgi:hypothetical protein
MRRKERKEMSSSSSTIPPAAKRLKVEEETMEEEQEIVRASLSKRALQGECKKRGLIDKGTKAALIDRIEMYENNKDKFLDLFAHPEFVEMFCFSEDDPGLLLVAHYDALQRFVTAMNTGGAGWPARPAWIQAGNNNNGDTFIQDLVARSMGVVGIPVGACFGHALFRCTGPQFGGLIWDFSSVQSEAYIQRVAVQAGIGAGANQQFLFQIGHISDAQNNGGRATQIPMIAPWGGRQLFH